MRLCAKCFSVGTAERRVCIAISGDSMFLGKKSVIDRLNFSSFDFLNITARENPFSSQGRKPLNWIKRHGLSRTGTITSPGAARVVDADRFVHLDLARHCFRRRERDLAERNANVGMNFARAVNLF